MTDEEIKDNITDDKTKERYFYVSLAYDLITMGCRLFKDLRKVENLEERIQMLQQEIQTSEPTEQN